MISQFLRTIVKYIENKGIPRNTYSAILIPLIEKEYSSNFLNNFLIYLNKVFRTSISARFSLFFSEICLFRANFFRFDFNIGYAFL